MASAKKQEPSASSGQEAERVLRHLREDAGEPAGAGCLLAALPGENERDWDPFVVWRRQVSGADTSPPRPAAPANTDGDWQPFDVWASHFGTGADRPRR